MAARHRQTGAIGPDDSTHGYFIVWRELAQDEAMKSEAVHPMPEVIEELVAAKTSEEVRSICERAIRTTSLPMFRPTMPEKPFVEDGVLESQSSVWPDGNYPLDPLGTENGDSQILKSTSLAFVLMEHADRFISAKRESRFPHSSTRPTSRNKQLWFLSRALAGAVCGIETRTALDRVSSELPPHLTAKRNSFRREK